jgi:cytochrome P450
VNSLARADSALKETLRLRTSIKALATEVTAPAGVVLEGYDVRLPKGARLAVSAWGIHRDKAIYGENADDYDAFRFCRSLVPEVGKEEVVSSETEKADSGGKDSNGSATPTSTKTGTSSAKIDLMVSASENYLPFGMGRHSCPGRYFAAAELKLFLAYLAVHYDLQMADAGRPGFVSIGHFPIPPLNGKLRVRRKTPGLLPAAREVTAVV